MKTILLTIAMWLLTASVSYGQVGELSPFRLRVGNVGVPVCIDAKVIQVINENRMLVGIEHCRLADGKYSTWIMLECSTKGITDGKHWRGRHWKLITGSPVLAVTGTTTYTTASGGTKTVFVFKPLGEKELAEYAEAALFRTWTTRKKATFVGKFIELKKGRVYTELKDDGKKVDFRRSSLSKKDQKWNRNERKRQKDIKREKLKRLKKEKLKELKRQKEEK